MASNPIDITINGRSHQVSFSFEITLMRALRELGYTDVKNGCEKGDCGACAVLLDGKPVNSCMVLVCETDGSEILTNAGLGSLDDPHLLQEALADSGGVQCGYCTPGMIISAKALLDQTCNPTTSEIREAISGNLCRCGAYNQIANAIQMAAEKMTSSTDKVSGEGGEA